MAFEITLPEALAILEVTRAELRFLIQRGDLKEFVVSDPKGRVVRKFLHYEEVVELAKRLERPIPVPRRVYPSGENRRSRPRDPSLLTGTEAAHVLGTTPRIFRRFVAAGRLPIAKETGSGRYFRRVDVTTLLEDLQEDHGLPPGGLELAPGDELVGAVQAAKLLQVSPGRVYAYVKKGALPVARVSPSGQRRFRRSDVLALAIMLGEKRLKSGTDG